MVAEGSFDVNIKGGLLDAAPGGGAGGGGLLGGLGLGGLGKLLPVSLSIAGMMALLVASSKALQGILKGLGKVILIALKPIGDILGIALLPILFAIKPIALFFNTLMRPFIQRALLSMRAGGLLLREGKTEEAKGAFTLGAGFLLQPFINALVVGIGDLVGLGEQARQFTEEFSTQMDVGLGVILANTALFTDTNATLWINSLAKSGEDTKTISNAITTTLASNLLTVSNTMSGIDIIVNDKAKNVLDSFSAMMDGIEERARGEPIEIGIRAAFPGKAPLEIFKATGDPDALFTAIE